MFVKSDFFAINPNCKLPQKCRLTLFMTPLNFLNNCCDLLLKLFGDRQRHGKLDFRYIDLKEKSPVKELK